MDKKSEFIEELLVLYREFQHGSEYSPRVTFDGDSFREFIKFIDKHYGKIDRDLGSAQTPQGSTQES